MSGDEVVLAICQGFFLLPSCEIGYPKMISAVRKVLARIWRAMEFESERARRHRMFADCFGANRAAGGLDSADDSTDGISGE